MAGITSPFDYAGYSVGTPPVPPDSGFSGIIDWTGIPAGLVPITTSAAPTTSPAGPPLRPRITPQRPTVRPPFRELHEVVAEAVLATRFVSATVSSNISAAASAEFQWTTSIHTACDSDSIRLWQCECDTVILRLDARAIRYDTAHAFCHKAVSDTRLSNIAATHQISTLCTINACVHFSVIASANYKRLSGEITEDLLFDLLDF